MAARRSGVLCLWLGRRKSSGGDAERGSLGERVPRADTSARAHPNDKCRSDTPTQTLRAPAKLRPPRNAPPTRLLPFD